MHFTTMNLVRSLLSLLALVVAGPAWGTTLQFVGSQANLDGGLFPGGGLPYVTAYWRTSTVNNVFAVDSAFPEQFYGTAGYALFATRFSYPSINDGISDPFISPDGQDPLFPNIVNLPSWVEDSQILAERMAGGFAYALVDDPRLMTNGIRHWTFDGVNYPPADGTNNTGQNPYVKIGFLDGLDILGNNPVNTPAGRWGFTVGEGAPAAFRVGVMTGGNDNGNFTPGEVFLQQFDGVTPVGSPVSTGTLEGTLRDRFVDMHFFDIRGAQPGDSFAFAVLAGPNSFGNSGIAGFSFDVLPAGADDADFNGDGSVDGADFLIWQRGLTSGGSGSLATGDATGDGNVDGADLSVWASQFSPSLTAAADAVPEPTAAVLLLPVAASLGLRRRR